MNTLNFCISLIPIIIFYLLLAYTKGAITFSNSILGKLVAIILIAFYANVDPILGLLVCILVIIYYQSDYVEGMLNLSSDYSGPFKYVDQPQIIETTVDNLDNTDPEILINNIPNVENLKKFCTGNTNNPNCQLVDLEYDMSDIDKYYDKTTVLKTIEIDEIHSNSITEKKLIIETELHKPKDGNTRSVI
jgi:hypothetical protein